MRLKSLDKLRGHPLLSLITSERGLFRALKMRPVGRCCFWHGTPLKMRRIPQEAVHSLWSRLFCGPLKMRRVPEKAVFGTEYLFRTVEACFLHRSLLKMRRVPQEAFLSTARIFRTIEGPLRYRMPTTQPPSHHSTPSTPSTLVPSPSHRGKLPPQWSLAYILVDLVYRQQHRHY